MTPFTAAGQTIRFNTASRQWFVADDYTNQVRFVTSDYADAVLWLRWFREGLD